MGQPLRFSLPHELEHARSHTHMPFHTDTQSLRGPCPGSKKSLPFHRGLLAHHLVAWPPCVVRGPRSPATRRVPRHLTIPGLLPSHQLQGRAASSNSSDSPRHNLPDFLPSPSVLSCPLFPSCDPGHKPLFFHPGTAANQHTEGRREPVSRPKDSRR